MAKFGAESVESMDYDFTELGGHGKGTVPEPTQKAMRAFQKAFTKIQIEATTLANEMAKLDPEKDGEKLDGLLEKSNELEDRTTELITKLCKGNPSQEEVDSLGFRARGAFGRWLLKQFSPEA